MTRSKLVGTSAQECNADVSQMAKEMDMWPYSPRLFPPHYLGPTPRTLLKGNRGGGKENKYRGAHQPRDGTG